MGDAWANPLSLGVTGAQATEKPGGQCSMHLGGALAEGRGS